MMMKITKKIGSAPGSEAKRSPHVIAGDGGAEILARLGQADDEGRVDQRRDEARQEPREEELADAFLHDDRVDHEDGRGRDQRGKRAARRDDTGGEGLVVVEFQHLRDGDAGEDGGGGDRRARDGGEARGGEDGGDAQPPRHPADPAFGHLEQRAGQARVIGEIADHDEGRDERQRVTA
jgi:hypothetical protein